LVHNRLDAPPIVLDITLIQHAQVISSFSADWLHLRQPIKALRELLKSLILSSLTVGFRALGIVHDVGCLVVFEFILFGEDILEA